MRFSEWLALAASVQSQQMMMEGIFPLITFIAYQSGGLDTFVYTPCEAIYFDLSELWL